MFKLKIMKKLISISVLLVLQLQLCFAQDSLDNVYMKDSLHPLSYYLENAILNSPIIKMHTATVDQKKLELQLVKYSWMREIYVTADTKLGNYGNTNPLEQFNLGYGTGAFIRLPLTAIVGNSERKKIAKLEIEASNFQKLNIEEELKKLVITQYNEVLLKRNLIKIQVQAVDVSLVNYKVAEQEYKGGTISIDAYARTTEIYFTQLSALEKIKSEYKNSLELLAEICGKN